jgi:tetratricopeptide (TPR) repeat protein
LWIVFRFTTLPVMTQIHNHDDRLTEALRLYESAVFGGDESAVAAAGPVLDSVEADLALARGRILHARFLADHQADPVELALFERAAHLYQELGDDRGEGEALFWVGIYHQVVARDGDRCGPLFTRAYQLSAAAGDRLMMSYSARHLGFCHLAADEWDQAHERLTESVRLRRAVGHQPGVAAGLLALAELAVRSGRSDEATDLLAEAAATAKAAGAAGTLRWVDEARAELATQSGA